MTHTNHKDIKGKLPVGSLPRIIKEAEELPIAATTMGPLRPLLSDHEPRKHAVKMAGSVKAILTNKI